MRQRRQVRTQPNAAENSTEKLLSNGPVRHERVSNTTAQLVLFIAILVFRVVNALLVRTQFDPDEFWQGLEPAHLLVYGRGWLTWEWAEGAAIRSWIHPLLLAVPLELLKVTGLDHVASTTFMTFAPRIFIQAPLLALSDLAVVKLGARIGDPRAALFALFLTLTNWFMFYCGIRTYSNSFEGCLTTIALAEWPLNVEDIQSKKYGVSLSLTLAAISIVVRPSALIIWVYLGATLAIFDLGIFTKDFWALVIFRVIPIGVTVLALAAMTDSFFYGQSHHSAGRGGMVLVPWNFFHLNFVKNISALYGVHSIHWYFTGCFPAILGIQLPLFLHGVVLASKRDNARAKRLVGLIAFGLTVLSLSAHKELRFAFPFLPASIAIASLSATELMKTTSPSFFSLSAKSKLGLLVIFIAGAIPALYLGLVHQRAALDASFYLSSPQFAGGDVDVLLNCHAMPLWGTIHPRNEKVKSIRFLDCSPHLEALKDAKGMNSSFKYPGSNETAEFVNDPRGFVLQRYSRGEAVPQVIITGSRFIEGVEGAVKELEGSSTSILGRCAVFPHAQDDVGGEIIVLCKSVADIEQ